MLTTVMEGAEELLLEVVSILAGSNTGDHIVIGGWCPYLRNATTVVHPGTLDVDLLFKDGSQAGALRPAMVALREAGFVLSAKHKFQLLREKTVAGERLIYNVDFLHPFGTTPHHGLFVDHLALDVLVDDTGRHVKSLVSIVQPNSSVLFEKHMFSEYEHRGVTFNLMDFTGMFITKMDSCQRAKRERDALDMYIAVINKGIDFEMVRRLAQRYSSINRSIVGLREYLTKPTSMFDDNVSQYVTLEHSASEVVMRAIDTIIS